MAKPKELLRVIRVFVPPNPTCGFLVGVGLSLFADTPGFTLSSSEPEAADVLLTSHFGDAPAGCPEAVIVFLDGESGSDYSARREAPISAAYSADIYIGPTSNHDTLRERGIRCEYIPFASLSFGQRQEYEPTALISVDSREPEPGAPLCCYLAHNSVPAREALFDELILAARQSGEKVTALGRCAGTLGTPNLEERRFRPDWIDNAVRLYRPFRFVMALENESVEGYVTEKLVNAYLAGCIPLYSGTDTAFEIFSKDSLIYVDEFDTPTEVARHVLAVASDRDECERLRRARPLVPGALTRYFSWHPSVPGPLGDRLREAVRSAVTIRRAMAPSKTSSGTSR